MTTSLTGKTALVTGASSGIGEQIARLLAAQGCHVILVARRAERLHALADALDQVEVHVIAMDLSADASAEALFEQVSEMGLQVDVLVNNAGFGFQKGLLSLSLDEHLAMVDVNVRTLTALTRLFVAPMVQRGAGWVLQVGSVAGYIPIPGMATYAASKAYVVSFGRALAEELRPAGVTVTTLCPGGTRTEFSDVAGQSIDGVKALAMMDARSVAQAGLNGLLRGQPVVVPGALYKTSLSGLRALPERWITRLAGRVMKQ